MSFRYKQDMISYELYNLLYFIIYNIIYTSLGKQYKKLISNT